jgi:hypothetical protein
MAVYGSINFPSGAAGNHLRWLLFLDQRFNNVVDMDTESKLAWIKQYIYPPERTWNNWLGFPDTTVGYEWTWRPKLDDIVAITHNNFMWENTADKELYLTFTDPELPYLHYYHVNIGLNNSTPDQVRKYEQDWANEFKLIENRIQEFPNKKIIYIDSLYDKVLKYELYKEVIDFFGFDDNFELAKQVHECYYQCRVKSARDFYEYFVKGEEFKKYLEYVKTLGYSN